MKNLSGFTIDPALSLTRETFTHRVCAVRASRLPLASPAISEPPTGANR